MSTADYNYKGQINSLKSKFEVLARHIHAGKIEDALAFGKDNDLLTEDFTNWLTSFESHGYDIPIVKSSDAEQTQALFGGARRIRKNRRSRKQRRSGRRTHRH